MDNDLELDYTKPWDFSLENTTAQTAGGDADSQATPTINDDSTKPASLTPSSAPRNPLLPLLPGEMGAFDGNHAYKFYSSDPNADVNPDDLTIPKDLYQSASDSDPNDGKSRNAIQSGTVGDAGVYGIAGGGTENAAPTKPSHQDEVYNRAEQLAEKPEVFVDGRRFSKTDYTDNPGAYSIDIADALFAREARLADQNVASQQNTTSGTNELANPGPIPGLGKGLQALVDRSYDLAKEPVNEVDGQVTSRSRYYTDDEYRRAILRGLLSEVHGSWQQIPNKEMKLINPNFDPRLATKEKIFKTGGKVYANLLTGGLGEVVALPESLKTAYDVGADLFSGDDD